MRLCRSVEVVLDALPGRGATRAQLAAKTLGDAHALDNGRPAAALVLAVWRAKAVPKLNPHEEGSLNIENENGDERISRRLGQSGRAGQRAGAAGPISEP